MSRPVCRRHPVWTTLLRRIAPLWRRWLGEAHSPSWTILLPVRWHLWCGSSYRDLEELLAERGIEPETDDSVVCLRIRSPRLAMDAFRRTCQILMLLRTIRLARALLHRAQVGRSRRLAGLLTAFLMTVAAVGLPLLSSSPAAAVAPGACGSVLLSGGSWLTSLGGGVDVKSNGANQGTGTSCAGSGAYGLQYQCTELINRLYQTKGWVNGTWSGNGGRSSEGATDSMYDRAPANLTKEPDGSITYLAPGDVVSINEYNNSNFVPDGHVFVVDTPGVVTSGTIALVSQNSGNSTNATPQRTATFTNGTLTLANSGSYSYPVIGVVHAPTDAASGGSSASHVYSHGPTDFNGDGVSDLVVDSGGQWAAFSGTGDNPPIFQGLSLGDPGCTPLVGDFNGDKVSDIVADCGGTWYAKTGGGAVIFAGIPLGDSTCAPFVGDFNGDGVTDIGARCGSTWNAKTGGPGTPIFQGVVFGDPACTPLVGDFNGDGTTDLAVDCGGTWYARTGGNVPIFSGIQLGDSTCTPFVGDFNGDGVSDIGARCGSTWNAKTGGPGTPIFQGLVFGDPGCTPLVGDVNGDGFSDLVIRCGSTWYAQTPGGTPLFAGVVRGAPTDVGITGMPSPLKPVAVQTTTLTSGTVGSPYTMSLHGTGGVGALHWSLVQGSLPAGLALSDGGLISGLPTESKSSTFSVKVTDSGAFKHWTTTQLSIIVTAAPAIVNSSLPTITGRTKVGRKLFAHAGLWSPSNLTYSYQWLRDGRLINGATGSNYRLTKSTKGHHISVMVTATKAGFGPSSAVSVRTRKIARARPPAAHSRLRSPPISEQVPASPPLAR